MIEAVISVALLATASVAVVRLARSSVDLQLRADREMAAVLTAQNTVGRLESIPSEQIVEEIAELERSYGDESGCEIRIAIRPFDRDATAGLHLRVEVTAGDDVRVTLHDWRLNPGRAVNGEEVDGDGIADAADTEGQDAEGPEQEEGQQDE